MRKVKKKKINKKGNRSNYQLPFIFSAQDNMFDPGPYQKGYGIIYKGFIFVHMFEYSEYSITNTENNYKNYHISNQVILF